eukprot:5547343-Prymnesium_polylepis.1
MRCHLRMRSGGGTTYQCTQLTRTEHAPMYEANRGAHQQLRQGCRQSGVLGVARRAFSDEWHECLQRYVYDRQNATRSMCHLISISSKGDRTQGVAAACGCMELLCVEPFDMASADKPERRT